MTTSDEQLLSDHEAAIALSELTLNGLIEWKGDEDFRFTEKGQDYAWKLWKNHPPRERAALYMLCKDMEDWLEHGSEAAPEGPAAP